MISCVIHLPDLIVDFGGPGHPCVLCWLDCARQISDRLMNVYPSYTSPPLLVVSSSREASCSLSTHGSSHYYRYTFRSQTIQSKVRKVANGDCVFNPSCAARTTPKGLTLLL